MDLSREYLELLRGHRRDCLWFLADGVVPTTRDAQLYTLDCIERYGPRSVYESARRLREWLLQHSNEAFAVS